VQLSKSLAVYSNPHFARREQNCLPARQRLRPRNNEFDGGQTGNADLVWISADGGEPNLILPARGAGGPHFTNEKDRIYVYTPAELVSLRYDGTDRRTHLNVKGSGIYFAEEPVSADDLVPSPMVSGSSLTFRISSMSLPCRRSAAKLPRSRLAAPPCR